ncbi:2225_t:CDS:2 [Funneliformis geosporum]|nr:2225_t:CDS:2 [Funneliformis geosporum]
MSTPATPSTPRQNGSPNNNPSSTTPQSVNDRKVIDNRPTFTSSFHAAPFQPGAVRKRRADALGFPVDAGPFFSQTQQHYNVYTVDRTNSLKLRINSKVDRGFFLADNDWTCYRRNYFQISSSFNIQGTTHPVNETEVTCLLEADGQFHPISQFLLGITARVSNSDKKIELVQHTPKRDKGPQMVPVPKAIRPGGNLNLSSVGSNSNIVTFERIQFKTATANNGKRRAAQQYYVVMVDLYAQVEGYESHFRVATSTSAPLVVRGRSPGHYADNHDRYNPMTMNPAFPNDRHMGFAHPSNPNGGPVMAQEFNGAPFPGYGQYPPFTGFPPVTAGPMRNETLLMMAGAPNGPTQSFHPQHPHPYMVPSISETGQHTQIDMHNMEVTTSNAHNSAFTSFESRQIPTTGANNTSAPGNKPFMKIEIPQSSELPDHPLTSPAYHTQGYVEGFMYHNGHPANNASVHHGGYHSDSEQQHHSNGLAHANGRGTRVDGSVQDSNNHHSGSPQMNGDKMNGSTVDPKSPTTNGGSNTTTPTTELGKSLGQLNMNNYRIEKLDETDKL